MHLRQTVISHSRLPTVRLSTTPWYVRWIVSPGLKSSTSGSGLPSMPCKETMDYCCEFHVSDTLSPAATPAPPSP